MRTPIAIVAALVLASTAPAAVVDVFPGGGTPLQDAITAASPGDTLRVHAGTYSESVTINKRLKLRGDGVDAVTIDAGCGNFRTVEVTTGAERVTIQGVTVTGGTFYDLDIWGTSVNRIKVKDTILIEACGSALYGINVYQATRVKLIGNEAYGYSDAGIYIGAIPADGGAKAVRNNCHDNVRGILLEDSPMDSKLIVRRNTTANNADGIFTSNADDAVISGNTVTGNTNNGIWLNATSENNRVRGNDISGSGGVDGVDDGTGNCWRGNTCAGTCPDVCP